jgi:hypothetical protein
MCGSLSANHRPGRHSYLFSIVVLVLVTKLWNHEGEEQGRRNYNDTNPEMSSLLVFLFVCLCSNFVGSESGQKQSVKLLQNMVYNTTHHPTPPPPPLNFIKHQSRRHLGFGVFIVPWSMYRSQDFKPTGNLTLQSVDLPEVSCKFLQTNFLNF